MSNRYFYFESIKLSDIKDFFNEDIYSFFIENCIYNLGELFNHNDSGILKTKVYNLEISDLEKDIKYNEINETIKLLKSNYLDEYIKVDYSSSLEKVKYILGFNDEQLKLLSENGITVLSELLNINWVEFFYIINLDSTAAKKIGTRLEVLKREYQKEIRCEKYKNLRSITLSDEKDLFSTLMFDELVSYNIENLNDLFLMEENGTLRNLICKHNEKYNEKYVMLIAIIKLLKCKYLNEDPKIDENIWIDKFSEKLGISSLECEDLKKYGIITLKQLYKIVQKKDFSELMCIRRFNGAKGIALLKKIQILYNYYKNNDFDTDNICSNVEQKLSALKSDLETLRENVQQIAKDCIKIQNQAIKKQDEIILSNTSIIEVRQFFSFKLFEFLLNNKILSLADLFSLDFSITREDFKPLNTVEQTRLHATINILKCKYLNDDPLIDESLSCIEFKQKLGISYGVYNYLCNKLKINTLSDLFLLYENNISKLHFRGGEDLIPKIDVLYNYIKVRHNSISFNLGLCKQYRN